jgi:hypothetical protein
MQVLAQGDAADFMFVRSWRSGAEVLLAAVSAAGAHRAAAAARARERPGPGGAVRPFHESEPDDDLILEALAERIAREAEALPRICPWCVKTLANGSAWCDGECEREWRRRLMPLPHRDESRMNVPSMARIVKRKADVAKSAAWREAHTGRS